MSGTLDRVVTSVAAQLMLATPSTADEMSERVLAQLVEQFGVDAGFLRHNDHNARASKLVAEWPSRYESRNPDPLAIVDFDADPFFARTEHAKKPAVVRPASTIHGYPCPVEVDGQEVRPSVAAVPLLWAGAVTTGVLGFIKYGERAWAREEISVLEGVAALFAQLQVRIAAEDKLRYLAEHDDLTDLHNRRALMTHLHSRLGTSRPGPVAVMFIDVDRMKCINDCLGHSAGDWFIRVFAQRLRMKVGSPGVLARIGGDEFVFVPDRPMSAGDAESFARQLQLMMECSVLIGGEMVSRTASIGVAVGVPGKDSAPDLVIRADQAAMKAKRSGGNAVVAFTEDMSLKDAFQRDIELHLGEVVDSDALVLHYQPEVDMRTGEITAVEALVRWQHPTRGLLLPGVFIGIAESINVAGKLGRWVIRRACADYSTWQSQGLPRDVKLRLNVSPVQLVSNGFVRTVAEIIDEFDIDPGSVCLEITERVVVSDIANTRRTLASLKDIGIQIAIDDFGTGFAVLSHLKSLPVDMLKIDTTFVRELGTNAGDLAIVRAIIGLAEAFDLELVAEGVETSAAAETLMRHGCYRAQGYLLSRPLAADAVAPLLHARRLNLPSCDHDNAYHAV